jgi:hypothetical protein
LLLAPKEPSSCSKTEKGPEYVATYSSGRTAAYRGPAVGNVERPLDSTLISVYGFDPAGILGKTEDPGTWQLNSVDDYIRYHTTTLIEKYGQERLVAFSASSPRCAELSRAVRIGSSDE